MSRARTGLLPEHAGGVAPPVHEELRLTIPVREALVRQDNRVELVGASTPNSDAPHRHDDLSVPPSLRRGLPYQFWRVTLTGIMPSGLVPAVIGHGPDRHRGLRMQDEPEFPHEWPAGVSVSWWERGDWLPCPACAAPLVWYEAGYVPGYRVCAAKPYHHVLLSTDGGSAKLVL